MIDAHLPDEDDADDLVAQRILCRKRTWEQIELLARLLSAERGYSITAAEVAMIALETGLAEVRRGASGQTRTPSGRTRRLTRPVQLSETEQAELQGLLAAEETTRGKQRAIALWLGLRRRKVATETLRELVLMNGAYDVANFAQNMKKDAALFRELQDPVSGARLGWRLTPVGREQAEILLVRASAAPVAPSLAPA